MATHSETRAVVQAMMGEAEEVAEGVPPEEARLEEILQEDLPLVATAAEVIRPEVLRVDILTVTILVFALRIFTRLPRATGMLAAVYRIPSTPPMAISALRPPTALNYSTISEIKKPIIFAGMAHAFNTFISVKTVTPTAPTVMIRDA